MITEEQQKEVAALFEECELLSKAQAEIVIKVQRIDMDLALKLAFTIARCGIDITGLILGFPQD